MNKKYVLAELVTAWLCIAVWAGSVAADDKPGKGRRFSQQDQVLEAVKRGEIRSLPEAQAAAEAAIPGQVVAVEIERRKGRLVYEFKIVAVGGRVREVYVDAASLSIVKIE
jgi:uncharacterized membrane protein YkoI